MAPGIARMTASEFLRLPEVQGARWELVQGEIVKSPVGNLDHSYSLAQLCCVMAGHVEGQELGQVFYAVDVVLGAEEVRVPDLVFFQTSRLPPKTATACEEIPDLCVEIISPTRAGVDRVEKFALYEACGVPHYWIVDPARQTMEAYSLESGRFVAVGRGGGNAVVRLPPFLELDISLAKLWRAKPLG